MKSALIALLAGILAAPLPAQRLQGRWGYQEEGQTVTLDLAEDPSKGRFAGTLVLSGVSVALAGPANRSAFNVETLDGAPLASGRYLQGHLEGDNLLLSIKLSGSPSELRLTRVGSGPPVREGAAAAGPLPPPIGRTPGARAEDFAGRWESASPDGSDLHTAELSADGATVQGTVLRLERGYFSGKVTVKEQLELRGTVQAGSLEFGGSLATSDGQQVPNVAGRAYRRGEYLVVRVGTYEIPLARPGVPLERDAGGSLEAAALARAVGGREYSRSSQAHGRGAFVGARVRLALCTDGSIAYSRSDLVATPGDLPETGVDAGTSWSRRGTWSVVLLAGAPVVRAHWQGTGTSYSLVDYVRIEPAAGGDSAVVDGTQLPVTGRC
jgi:hypothetical protein